MIHSVSCDKPSFRSVEFQSGFNVILADRAEGSGQKESRNGLGKSTLVEIIHFCLGGNKGKTLQKKELNNWSFTLELDIKGKRVHVTRNTEKTGSIIVEGDTSDWPVTPSPDKKTGQPVIGLTNWRNVLGALLFGLETSDTDLKYVPTFRSLISYFVRRNGQSGGFLKPFQQYKQQVEWDIQVNNAYLLGIDWEYASRLQVLKDRERVLAQIKQEAQSGLLAGLLGSIGELEALSITKESQAKQEEEQLGNFKVHPQYEQIENDANSLTQQIHEIVNKNITEKRLLEHYEASLEDEAEAKPEAIQKVYQEAGVILPELVTRRLDDVMSFHKQVVANRRDFLRTEIERLKDAIIRREQEKHTLTLKRAELMKVLEQHGALKEYTALQTRHQGTIAELKDLGIRIENLRKFEQGKSAIVIEKQLLQQEANRDLSERKVQKEKAVLLFNSNSESLYEAPGTLSIDVTENGFKFNVSIKRSGSHGISNMEIFCYDLMLAQLWAEKETSPGFLIHDSILFADVDERQRAFALQLAAKEAEQRGFQYICLMNSDNIPVKDFDSSFKFEQHVRQRFTDATPDGGLLGIRF